MQYYKKRFIFAIWRLHFLCAPHGVAYMGKAAPIIFNIQHFAETMRKALLLFALLLSVGMGVVAGNPVEIELWPSGAPHSGSDVGDTAKVIVYLPEASRATGRAVVICPGGAYAALAMGHEGCDWAPFFTGQGIAAIVLKYRMPHGNPKVPVEDAEEALRLVRRNAAAWHIDATKVGIMGFSAGGHLASVIATQATGDAAPNFQLLFYPVITMEPSFARACHDNLLGSGASKKEVRKYSSDQQVTRTTPKAFIALSDDDHVVLPAHGANYYMECYRHDVPASLHIYPSGGHGWGMQQSFPYHIEMLLDLKAWLNSL